jgi:hypothetical protein
MFGRLATNLRGNFVGYVALFVALGGTTYAATGGNFILGQTNTASSTTSLSAGTTGPALKATNTSTGTAGSFNVTAGHPPLSVNSSTKVTNLNADKLDGMDSTGFVSSSSLRRVGPLTVTASPPGNAVAVPIASIAGLSFAGVCVQNGSAGNDLIQTVVSSTAAHSAYASLTQVDAGSTFGSGDMNADQSYALADIQVPTGTPNVNPMSGSVVTASGQEVVFNLYQAMNARNQPSQCMFGGSFVVK